MWYGITSRQTISLAISGFIAASILAAQPVVQTQVFPLPGGGPQKIVWKLTQGPDGAMWFTTGCPISPCPANNNEEIGRITRGGIITEYVLPTLPAPNPYGITTGTDGALWFTERQVNKIGRITTAGALTEYALPLPAGPYEITAGPDGAMWFTEPNPGGYAIGRIATNGVVSIYGYGQGQADPTSIVAGPDGALWFTDVNVNRIGRITTQGQTTWYALPGVCNPIGIAVGSDQALWFTCFGGGVIGRITTIGTMTFYTIPTANSQPVYITSGPDGALWFAEQKDCKLARITTGGVFTEYAAGIACGEISVGLGALWSNTPVGSITRITFSDSTPPAITPVVTGTLGSSGWYRSDV